MAKCFYDLGNKWDPFRVFQVIANYYGYGQRYENEHPIPWHYVWDQAPLDEPICGYYNDKCPDTSKPFYVRFSRSARNMTDTFFTATPAAVSGAIGGLILLAGLISGLIFYIKARREAKAANSIWLAEWDELQVDHHRHGSSRTSMGSGVTSSFTTTSKSTLASGTITSNATSVRKPPPSTGKLAFGNWQGRAVMVRICEKHRIHLDKRTLTDIKIARSIVHENLLRFLGAVLEPEHLAVIGEYCSKGSLQVGRQADRHRQAEKQTLKRFYF